MSDMMLLFCNTLKSSNFVGYGDIDIDSNNNVNVLGRGINSGEVSVGVRTDAKTVLKPNGKGGFDIITSYPIK